MSDFFNNDHEIGGLRFLAVKSEALGKHRGDVTIYRPRASADSDPLPIVILLHGVYGSHWAWAAKGRVHETLERLIDAGKVRPMLLAMPSDGLYGDGSGYLQHRGADYERWIVEDVIAAVRQEIPQTAGTNAFIAGLSMGGFGALRIGAKYPDVFSAFSGLSSITHFDQMAYFVADFERLKSDSLEHGGVLDAMLANRTGLAPFRFDCGRDDPLIGVNRGLHEALEAEGVDHEYFEYDGGHDWDYWQKHISDSFEFFDRHG
jgi:enterochelin esterase-like enzyme